MFLKGIKVNAEELRILLENKNENFFKKLKYASINDLEYWEKRPENLPKEILVRYLNALDENREFFPNSSERLSPEGKYGTTGFKWVFKFEDELILMGNKIKIYIKGFFFEEHYPRGVEIQSFKKAKPKFRVVK